MRDRETAVDKVRKLIALASSPYDEEARSSAYKAAALIREFHDVVDPLQRGARAEAGSRWIPITSKYAGWCKSCREPYDIGDHVLWKRGAGCIHEDCDEPA